MFFFPSLYIGDFCSKFADSFSSNFETRTHVWSCTLLKKPPNTHSAWRSSMLTSACRLDSQLASQLQRITQHVNIPENVSAVQVDAAVVLALQHHLQQLSDPDMDTDASLQKRANFPLSTMKTSEQKGLQLMIIFIIDPSSRCSLN